MGISKIGKDAAEEAQSSGSSEYERYDVAGDAFAKSHPTTAVAGTPVALRTFNPPEGSTYGGLVLADPYVIADDADTENTTIVESTTEKGDDFKVVNTDDEMTRLIEDDDSTIALFDGNEFEGDIVDSFDLEDGQHLILKVGGSTLRRVMMCLDCNGDTDADVQRDENGDLILSDNGYPMQNGGLIEFKPGDEWDWQIARYPELREDLEGDVGVMIQRKKDVYEDYDGRAYFTTVLAETEDGWEDLQPTDEGEPELSNIIEAGWLEWSYDPAMEEVEGNSTTGQSSDGLTRQEIAAIDDIQESIEESEQDFETLGREDLTGLVSDNLSKFDPETAPAEVVDELESRQ